MPSQKTLEELQEENIRLRQDLEKTSAAEKHFRILAEESPNMIFINCGGRIVFANPPCTEIMGYTREEFYAEDFNFLDMIAPDYKETIIENFKLHQKGIEVAPYEYVLITRNGQPLDAIITTKIIPHNGTSAILGIITIITAQKKAEKKLRESEALNRGILQAAPLGIGMVVDRIFQFVNPAMCDMVGYSEMELVGSKSNLLYPSMAEFKRVGDIIYPQIQDSSVGSMETQFRRKDGSIFDVQIRVCALDPADLDSGLIFTAQNISEQKRFETSIKSAKEKYENLVDMAPDGIITVDLLGCITSVNKAFLEITDMPREEFVGRHFTQLATILSRDIPRYISLFTDILKGKQNRPFEFRWKTKDRIIRHGEIMTALIRKNGKITGIQAIIRDNTDKKEAELAQKIVYQIAEEARSATLFPELYKFIHRAVSQIMPAKENFYIALYDEQNSRLEFPYFVDQYESNPGPQPLGNGLTEYVLFSGKPLLATPEKLEELEKEGKITLIGPPCVDWLGVPLKHENSAIGVMVVQSYDQGIRFSETHINLFKFISDQIASVIERKKDEEQMKKRAVEYRALFEYGLDAIILFDVKGKVLAANRKAASMLGYKNGEMTGLSYKKLVAEEEEMDARSKLVLAKKSRSIPAYIRRCRRKDGSEFSAEFTVSPVHDEKGNLLFIQSVFRETAEKNLFRREFKDPKEPLHPGPAALQEPG